MRGFTGNRCEPKPSNFDRFRQLFSFLSSKVQNKMAENCHNFQLFPKASAPRPHGTPPKRCSRSRRCDSTKFHPDWTKRHPMHAHCSFQISIFFQPPQKNTFGHSGNHRAEERKSPFFHFPCVSFEDSTLSQFPFLRLVIYKCTRVQ